MRLSKALSLAFCLISLAACGGGGGGGGGGADTTSPAVSVSAPSAGARVSGTTTVTASATDNVGVSKVEFYANDTLQSSDSSAPYSFDWNTFLVTDGSYTLNAIAYDSAGNSATSANVTVTVGNDTTLPSVSITSPANSATVSGTVNITAAASDNISVTKVEFYVNDALQGTDNTFPYSFSWNTLPLATGSYTLTARAYDTATNVQQSAGVAVTVPISTAISTVVSGTTAVGTVSVYGLAAPDAYGLEFLVAVPVGASIASVTRSGIYAGSTGGTSPGVDPNAIIYASSNVGAGEVMTINFADVPSDATAASFGISLTAVFDGGGVLIQ